MRVERCVAAGGTTDGEWDEGLLEKTKRSTHNAKLYNFNRLYNIAQQYYGT